MFALPCLLFQADCFVRGLTLRPNNIVENLCMRPNIGPAVAGPAGPVATALQMYDATVLVFHIGTRGKLRAWGPGAKPLIVGHEDE